MTSATGSPVLFGKVVFHRQAPAVKVVSQKSTSLRRRFVAALLRALSSWGA